MKKSVIQHELKRVLDRYDLGELKRARRVERGFVNENWIIETTRGRYFLKHRHPDLRNRDVIGAQHALIRHLRKSGFPAPIVLPDASGKTLVVLDREFYDIQEYIDGMPCQHNSWAHFRAAAATLGHYHACVQGFAHPVLCRLGDLYGPEILATNLTRLTEAWELDRDAPPTKMVTQLESHAWDLTVRFAEHGELPQLITHGDYYADNLLFKNDRIVGVVDYDKARWQPRIAEVAEALIYFASPWPGHLKHLVYHSFLQWNKFTSFLREYACAVDSGGTERDILRSNEIHALPDYIRCIWLSISVQRLLEKGLRPPDPGEVLREVLALGEWSAAKTHRMVQSICTVVDTARGRKSEVRETQA